MNYLAKTAVAMAMALGYPAMAKAAEVEWRLNVFTVESRPESLAFKAFADRVSANSGGRLEIQVFYGGSLGIEASDALRALKSASIEAAHIFGVRPCGRTD